MRRVSDFYREREQLRRTVRDLAARPGALGLDVGCKHGDISRSLAGRLRRLVALDIEVHEEWKERDPRVTFLAASATALPFGDAVFDVVVSSECLQYVPNPEWMVAEMARVLKPGGTLVLSFPEGNALTTWLDPDNLIYGMKRLLGMPSALGQRFVRFPRARRVLRYGTGLLKRDTALRRGTLAFIWIAGLIDLVQGMRVRLLRRGKWTGRVANAVLGPLLELLFRLMNLDTALSPPFLWYNNVLRFRKPGGPKAPAAKAGSSRKRAPQPQQQPRRWRFRLAALALALAAAFAGSEILLRLAFGAPLPNRGPLMLRLASPTRGWQMMPGQDHYTYDQKVTLNELGLRSAPIGPKEPGEVRVLALGDSMVYGQGVAEADTIPARLEQRLASDGHGARVRVINAGHRGYATHEEVALLEETHDAIAPDIVVLFWYWNDVLESDIRETYEWLLRTGPVPFDTGYRLEGSRLWKWRGRQLLRQSAVVVYAYEGAQALTYKYPTAAEVSAAFGRLDGHLAHLGDLAATHGFRLLIAVVPEANSLRGPHWSIAWGERVVTMAERRGIAALSLLDAARASYRALGRLPIVPYDGHYTAPANTEMAARTAARIEELGWWLTQARVQ